MSEAVALVEVALLETVGFRGRDFEESLLPRHVRWGVRAAAPCLRFGESRFGNGWRALYPRGMCSGRGTTRGLHRRWWGNGGGRWLGPRAAGGITCGYPNGFASPPACVKDVPHPSAPLLLYR